VKKEWLNLKNSEFHSDCIGNLACQVYLKGVFRRWFLWLINRLIPFCVREKHYILADKTKEQGVKPPSILFLQQTTRRSSCKYSTMTSTEYMQCRLAAAMLLQFTLAAQRETSKRYLLGVRSRANNIYMFSRQAIRSCMNPISSSPWFCFVSLPCTSHVGRCCTVLQVAGWRRRALTICGHLLYPTPTPTGMAPRRRARHGGLPRNSGDTPLRLGLRLPPWAATFYTVRCNKKKPINHLLKMRMEMLYIYLLCFTLPIKFKNYIIYYMMTMISII
jgi:hypothetical protein